MKPSKALLFYSLCFLWGAFLCITLLAVIGMGFNPISLIFLIACIIMTCKLYKKIVRKFTGEKAEPNVAPTEEQSEEGPPSLQRSKIVIENYLLKNDSTEFFRGQLSRVHRGITAIIKKFEDFDKLLKTHFEPSEMSYSRYIQPINNLKEHLINLSDNVVMKLYHFDEEDYTNKIAEFIKAGKKDEANKYEAIEKEYKDQINSVVEQFSQANLRMDALILELTKLNNTTDGAKIIEALDDLIGDTKLYGK